MSNPCDAARPAPLRCPTTPEILEAALALLPRGRAWQSNEGGPQPGHDVAFDPGGYSDVDFVTDAEKPSILRRFWLAVADVFAFVNARLCALRLEFWCATQTETRDLWMAEYGLPDACDPFPDLCTKVAAIGGTRCEYYQFIAGRAGWSLTCDEENNHCGTRVGGRRSRAGHMRSGKSSGSIIKVIVDLKNSLAYSGPRHQRSLAGRMRAGRRQSCGPDLSPLECLMARVVHAEIQVTYEVINNG